MKALVQRVSQGWISYEGSLLCRIGAGLVVLLGVDRDDSEEDARYLAAKVVNLRIFPDAAGKFNLSLLDTRGSLLVTSQFTLLADTRKGHRPSFVHAAPPAQAKPLFELFIELLRGSGLPVQSGLFQKHLVVGVENDGPVTIMLDSKREG